MAAGTPCALATVVSCRPPTSAHPGDKAIITADGRLRGWIGGSCVDSLVRREALRALAEGHSRLVRTVAAEEVRESRRPGELTVATTCPSGGSVEVFIEPQRPRPLLLVFGASPAARTLLRLGGATGFRTCLVHPGARPVDFSEAEMVLPSLDVAPAAPGPDSWAVVATMGHYDEDAVEAALAHPELDVALVASDRRAGAVRAALRERGLSEATVARVRAPAGRLRAGSQEEIALLALAELVTRRHQLSRSPRLLPEAPVFATDPVCGMAVEVGVGERTDHAGATYHFCCAACRDQFELRPGRHLKAAEA